MNYDKNERTERTVWRKYLQHEQEGNGFLPEIKSAGIFCVREVSGYAVWYCRRLKDDAPSGLADGDYLLRFFTLSSKHSAIEFAVLASKPEVSSEEAIAALDEEAKKTMTLQEQQEVKPPFEQVQ